MISLGQKSLGLEGQPIRDKRIAPSPYGGQGVNQNSRPVSESFAEGTESDCGANGSDVGCFSAFGSVGDALIAASNLPLASSNAERSRLTCSCPTTVITSAISDTSSSKISGASSDELADATLD